PLVRFEEVIDASGMAPLVEDMLPAGVERHAFWRSCFVTTERAWPVPGAKEAPGRLSWAVLARGSLPLADLDEVPVWVGHVAADLMAPFCRQRQELGPLLAPLTVASMDVGDADVEEAADVVGVARRLKRGRSACHRWAGRRR